MSRIFEISRPSLLDRSPFDGGAGLSPLQSHLDGLVGSFAQQAADWRSLAAMTAGGLAYRAGRIGVMGLGSGSLLRAASVGLGLTAEVSAFEFTHRGLESVNPPNPPLSKGGEGGFSNLWRWNGPGGLRQGLLQSFVTFGALKGAGRLAQGENLIAQHLLQDSAMVLGHQVTGAFGLAARPTGSLAEQFLHAEATNLQLGAGMALAHGFAPGLSSLERGLEVSLSRSLILPSNSSETRGEGPAFALAFAFAGEAPAAPRRPGAEAKDHVVFNLGDGNEGGGQPPALPPVMEALRRQIEGRQSESEESLRETLAQVLKALIGRTTEVREKENLIARLKGVEELQAQDNRELLDWGALITRSQEDPGSVPPAASGLLRAMEWRYSRLLRTREQLSFALRTLKEDVSPKELFEIRRRLEWVLNTPEFEKPFLWQATPASIPPYDSTAFGRYERGLSILMGFHPYAFRDDLQIYAAVAQGPIRGMEIAFDIDKTLAEALIRPLAQEMMGKKPYAYDVPFGHFVHQYHLMRIPYRGMQALLLGLWAAGNRLKIYTSSDNVPNIHDSFFNDFPLLKIAFEFTSPSDPLRRLSPEDLHKHPHFMDRLKRKVFQASYLDTTEGRELLSALARERKLQRMPYLSETKIPMPGFNFDVLVDDTDYFAADMEALGFGRRWIPAGSVREIHSDLQAYFSRPRPFTVDRLRKWLGEEDATGASNVVVSLASRLKAQELSFPLQKIHETFLTWAGDLSVEEFNRQWEEFEFRLRRRPSAVVEAVAQLAQLNPMAAKVFLVSSGLCPAGTFLSSDPAVERSLFMNAEDNILPDLFDVGALAIWQRVVQETQNRTTLDGKRLALLTERQALERVGHLPVVIFQVLREPGLSPDFFYLLATHWGLNAR